MDILLIGLSFLYIFSVIGFSTIIFKKNQGELSRKFIHIMVGNWIFISVFLPMSKRQYSFRLCLSLLIYGAESIN